MHQMLQHHASDV